MRAQHSQSSLEPGRVERYSCCGAAASASIRAICGEDPFERARPALQTAVVFGAARG